MQTNDLNKEKLRRLAQLRPDDGACVLSLFLNLDPSEFATPPARETEIRSLTDQAERALRETDDLSHDAKQGLKQDIARAREYLSGADFSGAHGMALFLCGPANLLETMKLPRPIQSRAVIDDSPFVEPLADMGRRDSWAVLLVNRQVARMLRGTKEVLEEAERLRERERLDRLVEGVQRGGRAAAGLGDTLGVLNERRVETLMLTYGFTAAGKLCPECGSVYADNGDSACPADGAPLNV